MATMKLNVSLDTAVVQGMKRRASELKMPTSRYLAALIEADLKRQQDELAEEGYRLLSGETAAFAASALPLAGEVWPLWEEANNGE